MAQHCSFVNFQEIRNTLYFLDFSGGRGPNPLSPPPSWPAHDSEQKLCWPGCVDAQADLQQCCSFTTQIGFPMACLTNISHRHLSSKNRFNLACKQNPAMPISWPSNNLTMPDLIRVGIFMVISFKPVFNVKSGKKNAHGLFMSFLLLAKHKVLQKMCKTMFFSFHKSDCGRPWPAAYINFNQNTHHIQVLTKLLCRAQAIFYLLSNNEWGTKYRGLTYSAK